MIFKDLYHIKTIVTVITVAMFGVNQIWKMLKSLVLVKMLPWAKQKLLILNIQIRERYCEFDQSQNV